MTADYSMHSNFFLLNLQLDLTMKVWIKYWPFLLTLQSSLSVWTSLSFKIVLWRTLLNFLEFKQILRAFHYLQIQYLLSLRKTMTVSDSCTYHMQTVPHACTHCRILKTWELACFICTLAIFSTTCKDDISIKLGNDSISGSFSGETDVTYCVIRLESNVTIWKYSLSFIL